MNRPAAICSMPIGLLPFVFLVVAPWVVAAATLGSWAVAVGLVSLLVLATGFGSLLLKLGVPSVGEPYRGMLSGPVGLVALCAAEGLAVRSGGTSGIALLVCGVFGLIGAAAFWRNILTNRSQQVHFGLAIVTGSALVCLFYYVPSLALDATTDQTGAFRWLYVDTQFHMAVAAAVKSGPWPPRAPGMALQTLRYHLGPDALAAALSRLGHIDLADAFARVVRGSAQMALLSSTVALGGLLARRFGREGIGGPLGLVGFFFLGSPSALFAVRYSSSTDPIGAVLCQVPLAQDGFPPFAHVLMGVSVLWGSIGLLTTIALILASDCSKQGGERRDRGLLVLPSLVVPVNILAGMACAGLTAAAELWRRKARVPSLTSLFCVLAPLLLCSVAVAVMGLSGKPGAFSLDPGISGAWRDLFLWCVAGLGLKVVAIRWLGEWRRECSSLLLLVAIAGLGAFTLFLRTYGNDDAYGVRLLEPLLAVYAAVAVGVSVVEQAGNSRLGRSGQLTVDLVLLAGVHLSFAFAAASVPFLVFDLVAGRPFRTVGDVMVGGCLAGCALSLARWALQRSRIVGRALWGALLLVLLLQLAAIGSPIERYVFRGAEVVRCTSSELHALRYLRQSSPGGELVATNKHAIEAFRTRRERFYGYRALAELPLLLEGWEYGEKFSPLFDRVRRDNDEIFVTQDAARLKVLLDSYGITYLVARPGTDLMLPAPRPEWVTRVEETGAMRVYRVIR